MPRVVHFEISVDNPEKLVAFYRTVFGWEIFKWSGPQEYWLVNTGNDDLPGIDGGIYKSSKLFHGTINAIDVPNIDEYMEKVKECHGLVITEKMTIPGIGYIVYCKDTEGITFGLTQSDDNAGK